MSGNISGEHGFEAWSLSTEFSPSQSTERWIGRRREARDKDDGGRWRL